MEGFMQPEIWENLEVNKRKKPLARTGHMFFMLIGAIFVVGPSIVLSLPRFDKSGFLLCMPLLTYCGNQMDYSRHVVFHLSCQ